MSRTLERRFAVAPALNPQPPRWVGDLFTVPTAVVTRTTSADIMPVESRIIDRFSLLTTAVQDAADLDGPALMDAVASCYRALGRELASQERQAVRVWNFVPDIQGVVEDGDRYMAFNAGRFAAYVDWFGTVDAFAASLPTASAVGVVSSALSIHVLATDQASHSIDNPRQTPSYQYSRRYGVRPPCFSRATKVGAALLIGGTASILGQHSEHEGDIEAQTRETCRNIAALLRVALPNWSPERPLEAIQSLRVHVREAEHAAAVQAVLDEFVPRLSGIEFVHASLCRRELLVEIEGVASC